MKAPQALFLNGVCEKVFKEILSVQTRRPQQVMFLQPYSPTVITMLRDTSLSPESPIQVFFSTTDDLQTISYRAEIVGWDDKRSLSPERQAEINRQIAELQPGEGQLYHASKAAGGGERQSHSHFAPSQDRSSTAGQSAHQSERWTARVREQNPFGRVYLHSTDGLTTRETV